MNPFKRTGLRTQRRQGVEDANMGIIAHTPAHLPDALQLPDRRPPSRRSSGRLGRQAVEPLRAAQPRGAELRPAGRACGRGSRSLRIDAQGKALGQALLELEIDVSRTESFGLARHELQQGAKP